MQTGIDEMSRVLHCEEGNYYTAHSYFLETFEQLDQMEDKERALMCSTYMMLCWNLDSVFKALNISSKGGVGKFLFHRNEFSAFLKVTDCNYRSFCYSDALCNATEPFDNNFQPQNFMNNDGTSQLEAA